MHSIWTEWQNSGPDKVLVCLKYTLSKRCPVLQIWRGRVGVPQIKWVYVTSRLCNLLRMLNNDDPAVRELARASSLLHLKKQEVPCEEEGFLGFVNKPNGKLDTNTPGFGVCSDWIDLGDICNCANERLCWKHATGQPVKIENNKATDPAITVEAITLNSSIQHLNTQNCQRIILNSFQSRTAQHWTVLRFRGKFACLPHADRSMSHLVLWNTALHKDMQKFTDKACLQILPAKANWSVWYPTHHEPFCLLHRNQQKKNDCAYIEYTLLNDRMVAQNSKLSLTNQSLF